MKSEKGVTLTSLIIYVIAMLMVITILTVITSYFYKNIDIQKDTSTASTEFSRLEGYLAHEANLANNRITAINPATVENQRLVENGQVYFIVSDGYAPDNSQYTYVKANKAIYKDKIKIASNVEDCSIYNDDDTNTLRMDVTIKGQSKRLTYTFNR